MLRLIWADNARAQLLGIIDHIGAQNIAAAQRLERQIADAVELARKFPQVGRPGRLNGTRELIVHPNYIVIYQVIPNAIDVLRVLHARQRYP